MNAFEKDAYNLVSEILNNSIPYLSWKIVNIALDSRPVFRFNDYPYISETYGYSNYQTPLFLLAYKIFEADNKSNWHVGFNTPSELRRLVKSGSFYNKVVDKDHCKSGIPTYYHYSRSGKTMTSDRGPEMTGHLMVFVNLDYARKFLARFDQNEPRFNIDTGTLSFLGASVTFNGEVMKKSVSLLVNNINSMVSKHDFLVIPRDEVGNKNYKSTGEEETTFKEIAKKVSSNEVLKRCFVFHRHNSYGMFVDKKASEVQKYRDITPEK